MANTGVMLNAYPDSIGGDLAHIATLLEKSELNDVFSAFYILPSMFRSDLDRGFSVISYDLNDAYVQQADLERLKNLGIQLKLDFVLNHISVQSPQFQDILQNGLDSPYADFFINWNKFWDGHGEMTEAGYIQPNAELIKEMFFRKPGLPILMVRMPDGSQVPFWNTFYQEIIEPGKTYLGQMDLNIKSPMVWAYYEDVLAQLAQYGAKIVRLDAFAYAPKEVGEKNFLNEPGTWDVLERINQIGAKHALQLLPEIHSSYAEGTFKILATKGYMTYDFFLPGLLIDAIERGNGQTLAKWANEVIDHNIQTVHMLGSHDGIPLLDLKGLISDDEIETLIKTIVARGGYVKNLHGQKNVYYQVNATYYSALGEDDQKMLLSRAIHMFMPGIPQVWYLDLFMGKNDHDAVKRAGEGGHKEINRTNLTFDQAESLLCSPVVTKQLALIRLRNTHPAFDEHASITIDATDAQLRMAWQYGEHYATLNANLDNLTYTIDTSPVIGYDIE